MKYVKMLALAAVAAGALMAFIGAGTASASVLCSTTTDPCTSPWANQTLNMTLTRSLLLQTTANETVSTCTGGGSKGTLTNGSSTATASGPVTLANLTWTGCTFTTKTLAGGTLEIHKIAGTSNGTVTAKGFQVTDLAFGITTCVYETPEGTDLGTLTEGNPAVFHVEAAVLKVSGFGCPESSKWTATYTVTEPAGTTLSVSAG